MGPLLFLVDVKDTPKSNNHECIPFADDTTVLIKQKANVNLENDINITIKEIVHLLNRNSFSIKINKTKSKNFKLNLKNLPLNIDNGGKPIEKVLQIFGVNIDNLLNWNYHINIVCKNLINSCILLKE